MRVYKVPKEIRTLVIRESRVLKIPVESRTVKIKFENRKVTI